MAEAVGTSLMVVIMGSLVALADRLHSGGIDWAVVGAFAASAVCGVLIGTRVAARVGSRALTLGFAALVVLVALYTGADALAGLLGAS